MMVSIEVRDRACDEGRQIVLVAETASSPLAYEAHLGAGVHFGVDLMVPDRWVSASAESGDDASCPLLRALIGKRALCEVRDAVGSALVNQGPTDTGQVAVDLGRAAPWRRVAVVDALDRWVQLPLDQSLIDAERGVSRARAATSLPAHSEVRTVVIGEALRLARQAAAGLVRFQRVLGSSHAPVPARLLRGIDWLVDGYAVLATEVSGRDRDLATVLKTWRSTRPEVVGGERGGVSVEPTLAVPVPTSGARQVPAPVRSLIDPRQVRARVVALAGDPASAEVTLVDKRLVDGAGVCVRVPAYRRALDQDVVQRLLVRLVGRRSEDPHSQGLLTISPTPTGRPANGEQLYFEGTVPLLGSDVADLRADVFDVLSDVPPAPSDTDEELRGARRASVFLSEWRRLAAIAQLRPGAAAPTRELDELAERIRPASGEHRPTFVGGPTVAELRRLTARGVEELVGLLRSGCGDETPALASASGVLATTRDTGQLLVAELASAHSGPAA